MLQTKNPVNIPEQDGLSLSMLKRSVTLEADKLVQGLRAAPNLSSTAPCFRLLPIHFQVFIETCNELARRYSKPVQALLRLEHGKLLDAIVTFANTIWTPEQKEKFESCRCANHTRTDVRKFDHYLYEESRCYCPGFGPFHETIFKVFKVIADVVTDIKIGKASAIKLERDPGKRGKWPSSSSQFMPKGPATTVSAFVTWAQLIGNAKPLHALCSLSFCCPSLEPAMAENSNILPLIASLLSQFASSVRTLSPGTLTQNCRFCIEDDFISFYHIFTEKWFGDQLVELKTDETTLSSLRSIYDTLPIVIPLVDYYVSSLAPRQRCKTLFGITGWLIHTSLSRVSSFTLHPLFASAIDYAYNDRRGRELTVLTVSIILLRNQPTCTLISCTETNEDPKSDFKRCGGCHAVWYCSKACQREDWKAHKTVCKLLKGLLPIAFQYQRNNPSESVEERVQMIAEGIKAIGITREDMARVRAYVNARSREAADTTRAGKVESAIRGGPDSESESEPDPDSQDPV